MAIGALKIRGRACCAPGREGLTIDGRVRYTKMVIRQALLSLLEDQTIDKITVADICRLSEINRATFYRHYENQYSVLFELEDDLLKQIPGSEDPEDRIKKIFADFEEKKGQWSLLLAAHPEKSFSAKLCQTLQNWFPLAQPTPRRVLRHSFLLYGLSGLLVHWAEKGFQEPAGEMAECAIEFLQDLMRGESVSLI